MEKSDLESVVSLEEVITRKDLQSDAQQDAHDTFSTNRDAPLFLIECGNSYCKIQVQNFGENPDLYEVHSVSGAFSHQDF